MTAANRPAPTSVSVLFPAYDEEATIAAVLEEADALLRASGLDYEIVVCDDGSRDATPRILAELAARVPRLRVLRNPANLGIRATFERLYREARKDWVFLNSTDRQWPTAVLFELLPLAREHDLVVTRRRRKHYGPARALVSWAFNALPRLLFGVETHDAGSVKLVRREVIERLPVISRSPFAEAERLIRASRAGYRIASHPVEVAPRRKGRARGVSLRLVRLAALDLLRVWWDVHRGRRA